MEAGHSYLPVIQDFCIFGFEPILSKPIWLMPWASKYPKWLFLCPDLRLRSPADADHHWDTACRKFASLSPWADPGAFKGKISFFGSIAFGDSLRWQLRKSTQDRDKFLESISKNVDSRIEKNRSQTDQRKCHLIIKDESGYIEAF